MSKAEMKAEADALEHSDISESEDDISELNRELDELGKRLDELYKNVPPPEQPDDDCESCRL